MRKLLLFTLLVILPTSALAWNEKGHMVTARLACRTGIEYSAGQ